MIAITRLPGLQPDANTVMLQWTTNIQYLLSFTIHRHSSPILPPLFWHNSDQSKRTLRHFCDCNNCQSTAQPQWRNLSPMHLIHFSFSSRSLPGHLNDTHHCNGAHLKQPLKIMRWPFSPPVTWKQSISHWGPLAETEGELSGRQQLLRVDLLNNLLLSLVRLLSWSPAVNLSPRAAEYSKHLTYYWRTHLTSVQKKVFGTCVLVL